jgi:hypothetical protein
MGTALAHMLRSDATAADQADNWSAGPATEWSPDQPTGDQPADQTDQETGIGTADETSPPARTSKPRRTPGPADSRGPVDDPVPGPLRQRNERALDIARELAAAGKPVSRRALRDGGVKGSNESLNTLARQFNAELASERSTTP